MTDVRGPALALLACLPISCGGPAEPPAVSDIVAEARQLDLSGQHEPAVARYREALALAPDDFDAHYGIGRALDLAGQYDEAREHFSKAVALAPPELREQAMRMLGIAWTFAGRADQAAPWFEQVFTRRRDAGDRAGAAEVANELGRVHLELGDLDRAETWYRSGFETAQTTGRTPAQVDLAELRWTHAQARIAARRGDHDRALAYAAEVREVLNRGTNPGEERPYQYLVGYLALVRGDAAGAVEALQKADLDDPFNAFLLADAHARLDHDAIARDLYQTVLASASHGVGAAFVREEARRRLAGSGTR
ncbi:MAG TPA: tetratricopeptide repeat protein [Vicinamibacterales bacterium]|nr:tetratricopeptide repeat protein [Vicinamibacterales bacterium]